MKTFHIIACLSLVTFLLTGCRTVDKSKSIATMRNELDQSEQWRHNLPAEDNESVRPQFPSVKTATLKNGLTLLVVEDKRLPIVSLSFVTKNGSARDAHGMSGLMHLTGSMLKEGTADKTSMELAESFANLGTEVSVNVGKDMTTINSAALSDKVDSIVDLFAAMVQTPRMANEDFERIKLQHQNLLASQQAVLSYVAQTSFLMAAYGAKHPYAYPSAGTVPTVTLLSLDNIKKAHRDYFGPNASALIAVGDVSLAQIKKLAKLHFGNWQHKATMLSTISDPPAPKSMQTRLVSRAHSPQSYLLLGQPAVTQKDGDLATLEIISNILAGSPSSRLDAKLREEKGWTYGVNSGMSPLLGKGPVMIATSVQIPFTTDALNEILSQLDRLKKEPVSDDELSVAKNGLLHSFSGRFTTVGKVASTIVEQFVYSLPANYYETIYDKIGRVSTKDIMTVANRVFKKDNFIAVAVGDLDAMEAPMAKSDVGSITIE